MQEMDERLCMCFHAKWNFHDLSINKLSNRHAATRQVAQEKARLGENGLTREQWRFYLC
jgi:hypothetical protein